MEWFKLLGLLIGTGALIRTDKVPQRLFHFTRKKQNKKIQPQKEELFACILEAFTSECHS